MRELLTDFGFDGDRAPVVCGSALLALNGDGSEYGDKCIRKLIDALDEHVPIPERDFASTFMVPIDNTFLVPGRGTVVIGTIQRGTVKKNDAAELLGFNRQMKTSVSDIQVFKESVPQVRYVG